MLTADQVDQAYQALIRWQVPTQRLLTCIFMSLGIMAPEIRHGSVTE